MLNIWKRIEEIEKLLQDEEITGYRIEINTADKNYLVDKPERERQNTYAIGFEIPSKNEYEEWTKEACEWINKTGWLYKKGKKEYEHTKKYK